MSRMSLEDARRLLGWSLRRLAREADVHVSNIADIEKDRNKRPAYELVMKIIGALRRGGLQGLQPEDLFPVEQPATDGAPR
jgi:transcriptional regulator with XRE-family HTH domain